MKYFAQIVFALCLTREMFVAKAMPEAWCNKDATDCHIVLVVDYGLTMMHGKTLVKAHGGLLYKYDVTKYQGAYTYPADDVIVADAHPEPKFVMTYNGTIPGPALHMYHWQKIHLTVVNKMQYESTTVHLHGQYQMGSPYSDGVPFVTQCPILPGQIFTQIFDAHPKGSFFYHAHSGPQISNGLHGAFIVHSKTPETYDITKLDPYGHIPSRWTHELYETEHILFFQSYNHDWDANMATMKMRWGQYKEGEKIPSTKNLADINYSLFNFQAGLINGRGRNYEDCIIGPLSLFTVKKNQFYRFRLFNVGSVYPFRVTIESHRLLVVASDGYDIDPILVDSVVVNPGERFDVVIHTNQPTRNYWILGQTLQVGYDNRADAILNYEGHPEDDRQGIYYPSSTSSFTEVLNCPFSYYPVEAKTACINFDKIKSRYSKTDPELAGRVSKEFFLNFAFPGTTQTPGSVNGRAYKSPPISLVTQPEDYYETCEKHDCSHDKICYCPHTIDIQRGEIIQMVLTNIGSGQGWDHPVHLHGHGFQVNKIVYPSYNKKTGKFIKQTDDIECKSKFCNTMDWKIESWRNGSREDLNLIDPPIKDNLIIPSGGYAVVRLKSDNPGMWLIHCHLVLHFHDGMAALISEDKANWPQRPAGFPTCNNYIPKDQS